MFKYYDDRPFKSRRDSRDPSPEEIEARVANVCFRALKIDGERVLSAKYPNPALGERSLYTKWSPDMNRKFSIDWNSGVSVLLMASRYNITSSSVYARRVFLNLPDR